MNKTQLIAAVTDELNGAFQGEDAEWTKAEVKDALEAFERVVVASCQQGEPVMLSGFVKFARVDRPARMGRNPATGESIKIAAKSVAKVTALKGFKDAVLSAPKARRKK